MSTRREVLEQLHQQLEAVVGFAGDPRAHAWMASRVGVSLPRSQASALWAVQSHGPLRLADLAVLLDVDASNLSRTVSALVDAGLVGREAGEDRRARALTLTSKGHRVGGRLRQEWSKALGARLAGWSDKDLAAAAQLLARLTDSLSGADQQPAPSG
ncbi:MAG: MarR family winged helix-turn-helix transcriptional regulator, partial [Mycobacteriales bacterium]